MSTETIVIIGSRGSGKTHLARTEILPQRRPLIVYDTIDEFENYPGLALAEDMPTLLDLVEINESIRIPSDSMPFESLCHLLLTVQEPYYLVVDEFHVLYEHHMNFQSDIPSFRPLFLLGNHNNVSMVIITQRAANLPKYVITQCTRLYVFHLWHKADISFLNDVVENADMFKDLKRFHYKMIEFEAPICVSDGVTHL